MDHVLESSSKKVRTLGRSLLPLVATIALSGCLVVSSPGASAEREGLRMLPKPRYESDMSVEQALRSRRSIRSFESDPLTLAEVSQLLWAAQGVTGYRFRTAPSAGALYPLEVRLVVGNVDGFPAGVYRYVPHEHALVKVLEGDVRDELATAAFWQEWAGKGSIVLVFSAVYERTTNKYGDRGIRYAHIEAGHAAQNVYLQAETLGLGTVMVGAFMDSTVKQLLQMSDEEQPLAILPVGRPR